MDNEAHWTPKFRGEGLELMPMRFVIVPDWRPLAQSWLRISGKMYGRRRLLPVVAHMCCGLRGSLQRFGELL